MAYKGSDMEYPCTKGKPTKGATNKIFPDNMGKKANKSMNKSMFNYAKNSIDASSGMGKGSGKGGMVNKNVVKYKSNSIFPASQ